MEKLTAKEEEVLRMFWNNGPLYVKEIVDMHDDPKPHFNTISTIVRALEEKGYVGHTQHGKSYQYHAVVAEEDMGKKSLSSIVGRYFKNSYLRVVPEQFLKSQNRSRKKVPIQSSSCPPR